MPTLEIPEATYQRLALLTFNVADFARFPGLTVLAPHAVAAPVP